MPTLDHLGELSVHPASRVGFSLPFHLHEVRAPGGARGRDVVRDWVEHLRADGRWAHVPERGLRELDVALPSIACDPHAWPIIVAPFRLEESARKELAGPSCRLLHVLRSRAGLRARTLHLVDVQIHVAGTGIAMFHASFGVEPADGQDVKAPDMLDVVQSFRRMKAWDAESARAAFVFAAGGSDDVLAAVVAQAQSHEARERKLARWLPELPEGAVGLLAHEVAWSVIEWAATAREGSRPRIARPRADVREAQRSPIHDYFMRTYLRLHASADATWTPALESETLRRFALGEGADYAHGPLGDTESALVRRFDNLAENTWGVSSEGSICLARTREAGGFFDHVLPSLLAGPYLVGMHLAILQRSVLLEESVRITEFSRRRARTWFGAHALRGAVMAIREDVMQFNLELHHLVVSTNPRHQALYECYRRCYLIDELYAEVKEEVSELDEWLERLSRSTLEGLLFLVSFVGFPVGVVLAFLGVGFLELTQPPLSWKDERVAVTVAAVFGAEALLAAAWIIARAWFRGRHR